MLTFRETGVVQPEFDCLGAGALGKACDVGIEERRTEKKRVVGIILVIEGRAPGL